jgi:hypothetical protein
MNAVTLFNLSWDYEHLGRAVLLQKLIDPQMPAIAQTQLLKVTRYISALNHASTTLNIFPCGRNFLDLANLSVGRA